jgi:hypothetical protein
VHTRAEAGVSGQHDGDLWRSAKAKMERDRSRVGSSVWIRCWVVYSHWEKFANGLATISDLGRPIRWAEVVISQVCQIISELNWGNIIAAIRTRSMWQTREVQRRETSVQKLSGPQRSRRKECVYPRSQKLRVSEFD